MGGPHDSKHRDLKSENERLRLENRRLLKRIEKSEVHESVYHALFTLSHDAIFLLDKYKIFDCNPMTTTIFGFEKEELKHRSFITSLIKGDSGPRSLFKEKLEASVGGTPQFFDMSFSHKDGHVIYCEVSSAALELFGRQFFLISLRDISQSKKFEQELRTKSAQLQATLNSLPFDFWMNDRNNRTIMQNDHSKKLWGEQAGRHMEEVTSKEEIKRLWRETNEKALQGKITDTERRYIIEGEKRIFRNIVAPIMADTQVMGILGLNIDITDDKETQERLQDVLQEREILLREIHHRVKNNLQLIISMINLQKGYLEEKELEVLKGIEGRITSMAVIHDQLYNSHSLSHIGMTEYLQQLIYSIMQMYDLQASNISITSDIKDLTLPIEKALPIGIIMNELLQNSITHGFLHQDSGLIEVVLSPEKDSGTRYCLTVRDNGCGAPADFDHTEEGLGMTLIQQLALQVSGEVSFQTSPGFTARLLFPVGDT